MSWIGSIICLALALLSVPGAPGAQGTGDTRRIGVLCGVRCVGAAYDALNESLRDRGWVAGHNLVLEVRGADGRLDQLPVMAAELARPDVDLIVAVGPQPNHAARAATSTIPIVMVAVADPVLVGLVQSLARPGGNITGLSTLVPGGFIAKQLELLTQTVPRVERIAVFWNSRNEVHRRNLPTELPPAAASLGVKLQMLDIREPAEVEGAFASAVRERADALLVVGDPIFHMPRERLPALASRTRLPAMYLVPELVRAGGLMSYGPDWLHMFRRAGDYADRILRGAKPADLPIEQPTKFELVINLKTANTLGLTIPPSLLVRADEVIR
jgi:putative ABC transport system substrate-binding protein